VNAPPYRWHADVLTGPPQTRPRIAQRGAEVGRTGLLTMCATPSRAKNVRNATHPRRGSVHSCSQYVTRPPLWHTKRTPPSWEITTATDPGSAPAKGLFTNVVEEVFSEVRRLGVLDIILQGRTGRAKLRRAVRALRNGPRRRASRSVGPPEHIEMEEAFGLA
jgi:hypothetical protein